MSLPWRTLNVDVSTAIKLKFDFNKLISSSTRVKEHGWDMWAYRASELNDLFNSDWLESISDLGINHALLFYRKPWFQHPNAHIDMPYNPGASLSAAMNWVVGNDTSEMVWYKTPNNVNFDDYVFTQTDNAYIPFPVETLELEATHKIGNTLTLVRVDIPHTVIMGKEPRMVVSLRSSHKAKLGEWDKIIEQFGRYINDT